MLKNKKRLIYFIFTILMMIIIFLFSSQASKDSNYLSYTIADKIYHKIDNMEEKNQANIIKEESKYNEKLNMNTDNKFPINNETFYNINYTIRKSAHISLYLMLGIFSLLFIRTYNIDWKKAIIITILFCFTYACLDEFNQYLRGTRTALFTDSLIDTFGCMFGCLIIVIINTIKMRKVQN